VVECQILSIQVGLPKVYQNADAPDDGEDRTWESGIFKHTVKGPVWLSETNLTGDGQADLVHHGGPDRALLLYSALHYPDWEVQFGYPVPYGGFGENFTVDEVDEHQVCLGDRWATDDIEIEVSQPRLPCFKLARRLDRPGLNVEVMNNRKGGWYARALKQGNVCEGETLKLIERPNPTWTIDRCFDTFLHQKKDAVVLRELVDLPQLSELWKDRLHKRISQLS